MHARRAIVNAAAAALANLPSTGARVYPGRAWPMAADGPPYLLVYARREQSQPLIMTASTRKLGRALTLIVDGIETGGTDDDAALDAIAAEVEAALAEDPSLGGAARDLWLTQTTLDVSPQDSERRIARVQLEFSVTYQTTAAAPETAL